MSELAYNYVTSEAHEALREMVQEPEFAAAEKGYTFVALTTGSRCRLLRRRNDRNPCGGARRYRIDWLYRGRTVLNLAILGLLWPTSAATFFHTSPRKNV